MGLAEPLEINIAVIELGGRANHHASMTQAFLVNHIVVVDNYSSRLEDGPDSDYMKVGKPVQCNNFILHSKD